VHAIVTAGGLSADGSRWKHSARRSLSSVKTLSQVLRGKMMTELGRAYRKGAFAQFDDFRDPLGFLLLMGRITRKSWNVYAKAPFHRGRHVIAYLGRYTHRVGIANSRLLAVSKRAVTFRTKGQGTETLTPCEFLGRFVRHVLPDRFHKIRHVGLYAPAARSRSIKARMCLGDCRRSRPRPSPQLRLAQWLARRMVCPHCGCRLVSLPIVHCRDPPAQTA
jgi:hypothetical protein